MLLLLLLLRACLIPATVSFHVSGTCMCVCLIVISILPTRRHAAIIHPCVHPFAHHYCSVTKFITTQHHKEVKLAEAQAKVEALTKQLKDGESAVATAQAALAEAQSQLSAWQGKVSELATTRRQLEGHISAMFSAPAWRASPRQTELADALAALQGQETEAARGLQTYGRGSQLLRESTQLLQQALQASPLGACNAWWRMQACGVWVVSCPGRALDCSALPVAVTHCLLPSASSLCIAAGPAADADVHDDGDGHGHGHGGRLWPPCARWVDAQLGCAAASPLGWSVLLFFSSRPDRPDCCWLATLIHTQDICLTILSRCRLFGAGGAGWERVGGTRRSRGS